MKLRQQNPESVYRTVQRFAVTPLSQCHKQTVPDVPITRGTVAVRKVLLSSNAETFHHTFCGGKYEPGSTQSGSNLVGGRPDGAGNTSKESVTATEQTNSGGHQASPVVYLTKQTGGRPIRVGFRFRPRSQKKRGFLFTGTVPYGREHSVFFKECPEEPGRVRTGAQAFRTLHPRPPRRFFTRRFSRRRTAPNTLVRHGSCTAGCCPDVLQS